MKKPTQEKMGRREFLKKNAFAAIALVASGIASKWLPFWKGRQKEPNTSMHPGRHYKELAG